MFTSHPAPKLPDEGGHAQSPVNPEPRVLPLLTDRQHGFITMGLKRHETPKRIAADFRRVFEIDLTPEELIACWRAPIALATPTGPRQESPSMQTPPPALWPADLPNETDRAPVNADAGDWDAPAGEAESAETEEREEYDEHNEYEEYDEHEEHDEREGPVLLSDAAREYIIEQMARFGKAWLIAEDVSREFGVRVDRDAVVACFRDRDTHATPTGPRQESADMPKLNDEIKEFIVKRIACYETPSRIAAAVRSTFGVEIDRRQVFEYDPARGRPLAQRWLDIHAAARAQFLRSVSEIGVAQKAIRLRMLDRFAQIAEDNSDYDKAARYLLQAARECGGFYERRNTTAVTDPLPTVPEGPAPRS
jgi:hypothetical protein